MRYDFASHGREVENVALCASLDVIFHGRVDTRGAERFAPDTGVPVTPLASMTAFAGRQSPICVEQRWAEMLS